MYDILSASGTIMVIESKNTFHSVKTTEKDKEAYSKAKENYGNSKNSSSSKKSGIFYDHCKIASQTGRSAKRFTRISSQKGEKRITKVEG